MTKFLSLSFDDKVMVILMCLALLLFAPLAVWIPINCYLDALQHDTSFWYFFSWQAWILFGSAVLVTLVALATIYGIMRERVDTE